MASSPDVQSPGDKIGELTVFKQKRLGGNSGGTLVYEGLLMGSKRVAIKRIKKLRGSKQPVELANPPLAHDNVADYLIVEEDNLYLYWAMDLCAGSLDRLIDGSYKGPSPGEMIQVLHQTLLGLDYLHSKNIIHGNLKPQNIMISLPDSDRSPPKVKLADFRIQKHQPIETHGCWSPPEAYDEGSRGDQARKRECSADVFSLGCIFAYALTGGSHPYGEEDDQYANIISGKINWTNEKNVSIPKLKGLIMLMIAHEPKTRPTIKTILQHQSFKVLYDLEKSTLLLENIRISTQLPATMQRSNKLLGQPRAMIPRIPTNGDSIGETSSIGVKVYEAIVNGNLRAVKRIDTKLYATNYVKEIEILTAPQMSNCQYLVRYFSHEADNNFCYIEMERCTGSLYSFVQEKKLSTVFGGNRLKTRAFQKKIIEGIVFLHNQMYMVHRDIKPSNILIFQNQGELTPKIADYGISEFVKDDNSGSFIPTQMFRGTDGWKAPELKAYSSYSKAVDIFAAGCLLYYIETEGCHPFAAQQPGVIGSEVQRNIDSFTLNMGSLLKIEPTFLDLIGRALERDGEKRITAAGMLAHPAFFSNEEAINYLKAVAELGPIKMDQIFKRLDPAFVTVMINEDWRKVLDDEVFKEAMLGPKRRSMGKFKEQDYGKSLCNLITLIRNKSAHFEEMSERAKSLIGGSNKYFEYWNKKFPHLLVNTWSEAEGLPRPKLLNQLRDETIKQFTESQNLSSHEKDGIKCTPLVSKKKPLDSGKPSTPAKSWFSFSMLGSLLTKEKKDLTITNRFYVETQTRSAKEKKSVFHLLTVFPVRQENTGKQLRAIADLDASKKEIIHRLRHRIDLSVSAQEDDQDDCEDEILVEGVGFSRSLYDTFLSLLTDYDSSGVSEMFNLLMESRFTVPLFNPLSNENYSMLLKEICVPALVNEPAIILGEDISLNRIAVASCRNMHETQVLGLLKDMFNIDSLHRNDLFFNSLTEKELTIDLGFGYMGKKSQQRSESNHVLVVHVVGNFLEAMKFINDFADVLLIEDAPANEKGESFRSRIERKEVRRMKSCAKILLWAPTTSGKLTCISEEENTKMYGFPYSSVAIQYGERLFSKLSSIIREQFTNRRLNRMQLSKMNLLDDHPTKLVFFGPSYVDLFDSIKSHVGNVAEVRASLVLQRNFREQANYEENKRVSRLREDVLMEVNKKINECTEQRNKISPKVKELPLIKYFISLLENKDQSVRVATLRQLEQSLNRLTDTQLETQQNKINQYYSQLIACGAHVSNQNNENAKEIEKLYVDCKLNFRESMLHIEHLWRELSHLYVADAYRNESVELPRLAAQHMLDGFAIELLDGDASLINLPWIQAVFSNLSELMEPQKRRIFVLSVMGIQSSGKSTLLNTMFGIKMRTSVGQCTRGINMQLVPVEGRHEYDYVLILDTEGTRSPEHWGMPGNEKRDNQMATLSILLADATIIVNPGENDAAVKEILPIVLMAYQSSKLAEDSCGRLSSMMFFVYNRINTNEREKLSNIIQTLSNSLMDAFRKVQAMSGYSANVTAGQPIENANRLFRHFVLDASNSTESDVRVLGYNKKSFVPPDNVPDSSYGEALVEFREHIHKRVAESRGKLGWQSHSPIELSKYLHEIWNCICSADFSLQFTTVMERMAFDQLDTEYQNIERKLVKSYHSKFTSLRKSMAKEAVVSSSLRENTGGEEIGPTTLHEAVEQRLQSTMNKIVSALDSDFIKITTSQGRAKWRSSYEQRWSVFKVKQEQFWYRQLHYSFDAIYCYDRKVEELKSKLRKAIDEQFSGQNPEVLQKLQPSEEQFKTLMEEHISLAEAAYPPLDVKQCIKDFYADNITVQGHQIEFKNKNYKKTCKNIHSIILRQDKVNEKELKEAVCNETKKLLPTALDLTCSELASCIIRIQCFIEESLDDIECYEEGVVSETIKKTDLVLSDSGLGTTEFSQRQLIHSYARISLMFHMEKIQKKWEACNSVSSKLKRKSSRIAMWNYFQVASQGAGKVRLFGHILKEKFMDIQKTYKTEVMVRTFQRINRQDWMQYVLLAQYHMDLYLGGYVKNRQFPQIIKYIRNPDELLILAIRHAIALAIIQVLQEKSCEAFKRDLTGALTYATRGALNSSKFRARKFLELLQTCLLKSISVESFSMLGLNLNPTEYNELDLETPDEFRKECHLKIEQAINEQSGPDDMMEDFIRQILDLIIDKLRAGAWTGIFLRCQHCCPWCGSMCVRQSGHDPIRFKHDAIHQPAGLVGKKFPPVFGILETRSCSDLKPNDVLETTWYYGTQCTYYFQNWCSRFPSWEKPRPMQRNPLREYIFYHNHREFAKEYGAKPSPIVPEQYNRPDLNSIISNIEHGVY